MKYNNRYYSCIGLDNPKTDSNVGSVLRAASIFDCQMVAVRGKRYKKSATDTTKYFRHHPFLQVKDLYDVIPYHCVPVAVEIVPEAESLITYQHPRRAFYVFGAEDDTLNKKVLSWCHNVIYIPTRYCLNLAACVNVVLYDRLSKIDYLRSTE